MIHLVNPIQTIIILSRIHVIVLQTTRQITKTNLITVLDSIPSIKSTVLVEDSHMIAADMLPSPSGCWSILSWPFSSIAAQPGEDCLYCGVLDS
ncbi:predicted protein [Lichtheimia corymbifera JMRC:FSU:9682]|uniref:Uncharacterized protein n=1 Tax=Lichtheimia corymbifera JMRC:FSU:9682 TaxID=1263082 RepID=A0A068S2V9_9FUNG|nr:predicted protein [Lichtheimia corymbifera JMRC:FSU:9682]